jgi:CHASE2 domain-containing sensor protein
VSDARTEAPPRCPYPGLAPFTDDYAALFCGRERAVKQVVDSLLAHRITVLCGPSGAGKSSLVNVGVLPAIERRDRERAAGASDERFYTAVHCAGWDRDDPAAAVRDRVVEQLLGKQAAELRGAPLADVLPAAARHVGGRLLLVLDQFEELFAGGRPAHLGLAAAIAAAPAAVHVLITIREDALGQLDSFADVVPRLLDNVVRLDHLDEEAARTAIVEPARRWSKLEGVDPIEVEEDLVDAVVAQASERDLDPPRVQAPLLQLVMRRLCRELDERAPEPGRRVLDGALLARLGGTRRIVADHVDEAVAGWRRAERDLLARMLDHLVAASGAKVPQSAAELAARIDAPEGDVARVLGRLTEPRILERVGERHQLHHDALSEPLLDWRRRWEHEQARRRGWLRLGLMVAFVAALMLLAAYAQAFAPLESLSVGARFQLRGPEPPPRDVVVVAIDEASLRRLGYDWPVPRPRLGDVVDWIAEGHPKVIAYDGVLAGRSRLKRDDASLASAFYGTARGKVVIAAEATAPGGRTNVFGGNAVLARLGVRPGYVGFRDDVNGVFHRPVYAVDGLDSFAVAASEVATGRRVARGDVERAWIDFHGPRGTLRSVPFWRVYERRVPRDAFRGKIVVIGPTGPADTPYRPVWGIHADRMPDVELQATAIDTVRRGLPLKSPPWWVTAVSIAALALLPPLLHRRRLPLPATLALSLAGGLLFLLVTYAAFALGGWMLAVVAPLAALLFAALAVTLIAATPAPERRRRRASRVGLTATLALMSLAVAAACASAASFASDPLVQVGAKLQPSDGTPYRAFGDSVALSADGGAALVGAPDDADGDGAAWVFVKQDGRWIQQGPKLVPQDSDGGAEFGRSVALSADGGTALIGGWDEDDGHGAAWAFTRTGGAWTQQGAKLLPADPALTPPEVFFGYRVALSADGDTALIGGHGDGYGYGAAWAFTRAGGVWTQQGPKLTVPGETLGSDGTYSWFGSAVALSADGDTALIGGEHDADGLGAAWIFTRAGPTWTQGPKLTGAGESGLARFGRSVALSGDGSSALVGGEEDASSVGAAWAFARGDGSWAQQGTKLTATDEQGAGRFGAAVALDATGDDAVIGGWSDADELGAAWPFVRSGGGWTAHGAKLDPTDASDDYVAFGDAVALSADAQTLVLGGRDDNSGNGAAWIFTPADAPLAVPTLSISPGSANTPASVWDNADLFDGDRPTGTLTFSLYGPDAEDCADAPAGTLTIPVAGNGFYATGGGLTVSATGTYLDVVTYSGDARNAARSTVCGESAISVLFEPTLTVAVDGPRTVGAPLRLAPALQGGAAPSGTLDVRVYGPTEPDCGTPLLTKTLPVTAGDVGTMDYTPSASGVYRIEAFYSGDANNLSADLFCDDPAAQITVDRAFPSLSVAPSPSVPVGSPVHAVAHLNGGSSPSGGVRFVLYPPSSDGCGGSPAGIVSAVLDHGTAVSGDFATKTAGTYRFVVAYAGDAQNHESQSPCDAATVAVTKRRPRLTVRAQGGATPARDGTGTIAESGELTGALEPTGSVAFALYGPGDRACRRAPAFSSVEPLSGETANERLAYLAPGRYEVVARYGGDANNEAAASSCGSVSATVPASARARLVRVTPTRSGVAARVLCGGRSAQVCSGTLRLVAAPAATRAVTVGRTRFTFGAGAAKTLFVALNAAGRRLHRRFGTVVVTVLALLKRPDDPLVSARAHVTLPASGGK